MTTKKKTSAKTNGARQRRVSGKLKQPKPPLPEQHQEKPGLESKLKPRPHYQASRYRGSGKLEDKVALITGGDSGIGRAVAVLFAREGADVAITYLPEEKTDAEESKEAIEAEGRNALVIEGDVCKPEVCRKIVARAVKEFGKLDILVNNAAYQQHQEKLEDLTEEQWDRTFKTNIYGYFYMAKAALPHLREGSAIINTGSITGLEGSKQLLDYATTLASRAASSYLITLRPKARFMLSRKRWRKILLTAGFALIAWRPGPCGLL